MRRELSDFEEWMYGEELSENTIKSYCFAVESYLEKYQNFSKKNIVAWKVELSETLSPKSVNLRLSAIRKYCRFANIPYDVRQIKVQKQMSVENVMTVEEYYKLINGLEESGEYIWAAYYKILAKTGARISEFLRFKKSDFIRGYSQMQTKGKVRKIYFPDALKKEVSNILANKHDADYICTNRYGEQMTSRGFATMLKKHAELYGIPPESAHPHSFRHLFAIEFLKRNQNISLLADLMGHSNVNTTMIYLRLSQGEQIAELNKAVIW